MMAIDTLRTILHQAAMLQNHSRNIHHHTMHIWCILIVGGLNVLNIVHEDLGELL